MALPPPIPEHLSAARALLETIRLRPVELDRHVECAGSVDYWRTLVSSLTIEGPSLADNAVAAMAADTRREIEQDFHDDGVIKTPPMVSTELAAKMRSAVAAIIRADWPAVFAWVFDAFWQVPRSPALVELLESVAGSGCRQTRHLWTHVVAGRRGSSGWRPHQDYTGDDPRVTVWIALSDATVETGCISLIPRQLVPDALQKSWSSIASVEKTDVMSLLHASRPLPCQVGAVLAWDAGLMHWGSARQASGEPRVSVSLELVPASTPAEQIGPTFPLTAAPPAFATRIGLIAHALRLYQHGEARSVRYADLADRLIERFPV